MKNQKNQPFISVIMPVYNAGNFLVEAIESILNQTYKNFEFIIVDDASTDNSYKILKSYAKKNKRIRLFRNKKNLGISQTVKKAINKSKGDFLARMDADDICLPNRLAKQLNYLITNPNTVAVGTQCYIIDKDGNLIGEKKFPVKFEDVYKYILKFIPVQQPTLMINKKKLPRNFQYYHDGMQTAEEVELIFKLFKYGKVENLPEPLHLYRIHNGNTSFKNLKKTFFLTLAARVKALFIYDYKPNLSGLAFTLLQTVCVFLLPQAIVFWLYQRIRKIFNYQKQNIFTFLPKKNILVK